MFLRVTYRNIAWGPQQSACFLGTNPSVDSEALGVKEDLPKFNQEDPKRDDPPRLKPAPNLGFPRVKTFLIMHSVMRCNCSTPELEGSVLKI